MKKFLSALVVLVILVGTLSSCSVFDKSLEKYEYTGLDAYGEFAEGKGLMNFVYEETYLKFFEGDKWNIDMETIVPFGAPIDEGTYTVKDGIYYFDGFEYGLETYGEKTADGGFVIYMRAYHHLRANQLLCRVP